MYKGRSVPSRSKIQYLLHLSDCRHRATMDLQHTKAVVDKALLTVISDDFCCQKTGDPDKAIAHKVFTEFQMDLEFLIDELEDLAKPISTTREQIIEEMSLAQGQRALLLTVAASLFIPLSFVAVSLTIFLRALLRADHFLKSIFGMNVKDPLFPSPYENRHSVTSRFPTPTSTADPIYSGPSQHYWSMWQYLVISLPLTAAVTTVILLPVIAGPCFKFLSQQYETHRRHWRAYSVVLAVCYVVSVVFMAVFVVYLRSDDAFYYQLELVYLIWCYSVLGTICVVRVVHAYRQKQGRLRWFLQLLISTACLMFDLFLASRMSWALVSLMSLSLTSETGVRWLKGGRTWFIRGWTWLSWKTRRQSATGYASVL